MLRAHAHILMCRITVTVNLVITGDLSALHHFQAVAQLTSLERSTCEDARERFAILELHVCWIALENDRISLGPLHLYAPPALQSSRSSMFVGLRIVEEMNLRVSSRIGRASGRVHVGEEYLTLDLESQPLWAS